MRQISALESEYEGKIAQLQKAQRETMRESLFRPALPPLNRPAYLRPGEAFIHHDLPVQFASKSGEKKATNVYEEVELPTRSEGSVLESLPSKQLGKLFMRLFLFSMESCFCEFHLKVLELRS